MCQDCSQIFEWNTFACLWTNLGGNFRHHGLQALFETHNEIIIKWIIIDNKKKDIENEIRGIEKLILFSSA